MNIHIKRGKYIRKTYSQAQKEWSRYLRADDILYDMCSRWPHHKDLSAVQAKVTIIGRTYAAGLERKAGQDYRKGILETVANTLNNNSISIDREVATLRNLKRLSMPAQNLILATHGNMVSLLRKETKSNLNFRSFVSKYLHFHAPIVPLFDSRASSVIREWYPWRRFRNRIKLFYKESYDEVYSKFFAQFMLYFNDLKELKLSPTVRKADYYLIWWAS
jgi:hypothetical protein